MTALAVPPAAVGTAVVATELVPDAEKNLDRLGLTQVEFDAFNASSFSMGAIPEVAPHEVIA